MALISITAASVVPLARLPVAAFVANPAFGVVGSVVKLDGRLSTDPDQQPLTYAWRFISVPIGSQVENEGFRTLDTDTDTQSASQVSFSPDTVGEYVIGLTVTNTVFTSSEASKSVSIRAILIPHGRGLIPDGKFIWSYIRDVWSQVEGKEFFETLWSALIQITGTELLKLYQADFNKSIRDIQDRYQRRWIAYEPKLALTASDLSFYFGNHLAGSDASTLNLALEGQAVILAPDEVIVILGARAQNVAGESFTVVYSEDPANVGTYELQNLNAGRNGYKLVLPELDPTQDTIGSGVSWVFSIGSVNWEIEGAAAKKYAVSMSERPQLMDVLTPLFNSASGGGDDFKTGDVIHYASGPNAGFYRIISKSGSFITVDHAPPSFSAEGSPITSTVYRPVGYKLSQPASTSTNTFSIPYVPGADASVLAPGRIIVVNGQSYTIVRSLLDNNGVIPSIVITVDSEDLPANIRSLNWRAPHTLISQSVDFEALGVTTGDLLVFDILLADSELTSEVAVQVVGVRGKSLGFVLTTGAVAAGEIPDIPDAYFTQLVEDFGVSGLLVSREGTLSFTGTALEYLNSLSSGTFQRKYWNKELSPSSEIQVNPVFQLKPKYIIRNSKIPVDADLRSVPLLQEWIVQPTVDERDGKFFQITNDKEFELKRKPVVLNENLEYLIDGEVAFTGAMTINTGSNEIQADDADFLDRSMGPGDVLTIEAPLTLVGDYVIEKVLSNSKVRLTRPVPAYVLGTLASVTVTLTRKKTGAFLRFVPGLFTTLAPAPERMWAEVSFFDNGQSIEDNFGILVGLKKETLESVSKNINYRQAVAGLMFAFTRGSAIDKVRLGAQILLGLPFAEHRGIIRSIEQDYRLDVQGNATLGRLLIEDVDATGAILGTLRIYTYPIDAPSRLAGIETSPVTGLTYKVGDLVELFAPLTKGVEIIDYLTNPLDSNFSAIAQLQQFHSVRLRANDNIFGLNELDLVSGFLKKITPHYVAYSLITASEFADTVSITDTIINLLRSGDSNFVDNASLGLAPTLMFNSTNASGRNQILFGDGVHTVRRIGLDGVMANGAATITSAAAGFVNPKVNEQFEAPLVIPTDSVIVLTGVNQGIYTISAVANGVITVSDGPALGFEAETGISFVVVRKVTGVFGSGTANATSGSAVVDLDGTPQLRTRGVVPGDWLVLHNGTTGYRHLIREVKEITPGSGIWRRLDVTPPAKFTSAFASYFIYRPSLLPFPTLSVVSTGTNYLNATGNPELQGLLSIGDELITDEPDARRVTVLDPASMYCTPILPAGTYDVIPAYKNKSSSIICWDHIEKFDPLDEVEVSLVEGQALATCTAASKIVPLQVERTTAPAVAAAAYNPRTGGVLPGDLLLITSGANSTVDVGFGAGVYPIVLVTTTDVQLSVNLTNTGTASWKILRRR